ncbi:hypothetical protein [Spirochaeta dissipatitropha]
MKRSGIFSTAIMALIILLIFLGSCASAPESAAQDDPSLAEKAADPAADKGPDSGTPAQPELGTGIESDTQPDIKEDRFGFLRYDRKTAGQTLGFSPAGRVFALNQLFAHTGLSGWMDDDEWEALADHLFLDFPAESEGVFREVGIPRFFLDGGPLILQLGMLKPGEGARIPANSILVIHTNIYIDRLAGKIIAEQGRMASLDENIALVLLRMDDGNLVSIHNLDDGSYPPDSLDLTGNTGILLAAVTDWILDERQDNLEHVPAVLDELLSRDGLDALTRASVEMTAFQYYIRIGDDAAAETALERIAADDAMISIEEIELILENEAWPMLRLYRRLTARS